MPLLQLYASVSAGTDAGLRATVGIVTGPHLVNHMRGRIDQIMSGARTAVVAGALLVAAAWATPAELHWPRSEAVLAAALAIVLVTAVRFAVRTYRAKLMASKPEGEKAIALGTCLPCRRAVDNMPHDGLTPFAPVEVHRNARMTAVDLPLFAPDDHAASYISAAGVVPQYLAAPVAHPRKGF